VSYIVYVNSETQLKQVSYIVYVNSETQLKQHIKSRRHKDRVAGKPAKPKFSPYGLPPQRNQSVGITLRKEQDVAKPLASCLLQRHLSLAAAAAMATLSPFHLRPAPIPGPAIFQIQALPRPCYILPQDLS
uniref:zinc finger protein 385D-like n=1 Tax=Oncorhynchus gorbuscha TaxID=8017 RepID=UPI001EAF55C8